jgi:ribonucleoside-diphosphate reductase beta chain
LAFTQQILKILPQDDADYARIREETLPEMIRMFESAVSQEKVWARYLFKDGSMIGLNQQLLGDYIDWIGHKRMTAIGLPSSYKGGSNPLPWTAKWIAGADVQVAPQETEISAYKIGARDTSINDEAFENIKL